jgi:hypothetical protein
MKQIEWNKEKNELLKLTRGVCFEDVISAIEEGKLLDNRRHPNSNKYKVQRVFIVNLDGYAYVVPYVQDKRKIFLKTIFASRKETRRYLKKSI